MNHNKMYYIKLLLSVFLPVVIFCIGQAKESLAVDFTTNPATIDIQLLNGLTAKGDIVLDATPTGTSFNWTAVSSSAWLTVSPTTSGTTGASTYTVQYTVNSTGLNLGNYTGQLVFTSETISRIVTVNLEVIEASDVADPFNAAPSSITTSVLEGSNAQGQISLAGSAIFSWSAVSDVSWLSVSSSAMSGSDNYRVTYVANTSGFRPATYTGHIVFVSGQSQVAVTVAVTVLSKSIMEPLSISSYPSTVNLTAIEGGDTSIFNVVLYGSHNFRYGVGSDRNWLSITSNDSSAADKNVYSQAITVTPTSLAQGTYQGTVYFTFSDGQTRTVTVNLTVVADPANSSTFVPTGAVALEAGVGQTRTVSGVLMGQQAFDWAAISDSAWLSAQPASGTGGNLYTVNIVANAVGLLVRSEPYVGKLTIVTTLGTTHEITVALSVTATSSTTVEPITNLTYNTSSWLNLQQSINSANMSGRLFILMEHPQLVPYQQYAYRIGPYGPQLDLFSKWGRTVPNALDLAYASDVKTVSKVVIGGYRMSGLEGNLVVKLMVGNNVNNLSEIKRWNIQIMPLEGEWAVSDRYNGTWVPYPESTPLILDEKRTVLNAFWGGNPIAVSYGDSSTQLGSNFRICGTGAEMFCFNGPSASVGDSSYIINFQSQLAEIEHRVEWYEPTSMQGKWRYRWWGYDAWSVEQPFVALRTDLDISELVNSSNMPGARGELEIGLHWTNYNDIDLHVVDPSGETVYYGHTTASSGGMLDVDSNAACSGSVTNDAWEHIVWVTNPPAGEYKVKVNYFAHCDNAPQSSVFSVVVINGSEQQTFEGAVSTVGQTVDVATITVQ